MGWPRFSTPRGVLFAALSLCLAGGVSAQDRPWPTEGPPRPLAARDIKFPPYDIQTLPNGLQVVVVLQHEQPAVSMRLLIRAGAALDPKTKLGVAHLTASLLDQGTTTMSAEEMNDTIDFIGGAMGAGAATDVTFMNMVVMKDSFETGLRMVSDMARRPAFASAEIERQRQQMLSGLRVSLDDPEFVANAVFDRLVYGFHPYGMPDSGTPETIGSLTRDDVVAFHARYFAPNNAILAIVGDVSVDEAFAAAKKVFGDWERRDLPTSTFIQPPEPTRRVIVVNKPDAVQTELRVGHIGIARKNQDYMAVNLAIRILGGEGSNRLHQVLRTERGLTYGAQANMDTLKEGGDFEAETNTRSAATGEVLKVIVDEFWRLQRERVNERELADAKAYLTGSFPLTIETPEAIAMQVVNALFYGLPLDELQNFRERVNAVTVDDIQRVARAYLRPDRLSVALVGNAAAFTPQLGAAGFGTFETVELGDLDLTAANFKRGRESAKADGGRAVRWAGRSPAVTAVLRPASYQVAPLASRPSVDPTPAEAAKALAVLDRAIAAKGGLDALRTLKSIVATQTLTNGSSGGPPQMDTTTYIQYPDRMRIETHEASGTSVLGFDGSRAWLQDRRGSHDQPEALARDARASLSRDPVLLLLAAKDGQLRPRLLTEGPEIGGHRTEALELASHDREPFLLYVDPQTGLIDQLSFVADVPQRPLVTERFSDYRAVGGVQIAFHATRTIGAQTVERRVTEVKVNVDLDPALFTRPAS